MYECVLLARHLLCSHGALPLLGTFLARAFGLMASSIFYLLHRTLPPLGNFVARNLLFRTQI